jgi:antitoxin component YwqK of YwqJK toxin-antitoxin module
MAEPILDGPYRDYWLNGLLACEGQYSGGLQEGEWRFYNRDGTLREVVRFVSGREVPEWDDRFRPN